jgi:hypothetical protein
MPHKRKHDHYVAELILGSGTILMRRTALLRSPDDILHNHALTVGTVGGFINARADGLRSYRSNKKERTPRQLSEL